jgi:hypothetical protein
MEASGQFHVPADLSQGKKTKVPTGIQSLSWRGDEGKGQHLLSVFSALYIWSGRTAF